MEVIGDGDALKEWLIARLKPYGISLEDLEPEFKRALLQDLPDPLPAQPEVSKKAPTAKPLTICQKCRSFAVEPFACQTCWNFMKGSMRNARSDLVDMWRSMPLQLEKLVVKVFGAAADPHSVHLVCHRCDSKQISRGHRHLQRLCLRGSPCRVRLCLGNGAAVWQHGSPWAEQAVPLGAATGLANVQSHAGRTSRDPRRSRYGCEPLWLSTCWVPFARHSPSSAEAER